MSSRFIKIAASLATAVGVAALAAPAEAGGRHGGWPGGRHGDWHGGWHGGHHVRGVSFAFYPQPYLEPYSDVGYGSVVVTPRRYHRHHRKVCIRFPCY